MSRHGWGGQSRIDHRTRTGITEGCIGVVILDGSWAVRLMTEEGGEEEVLRAETTAQTLSMCEQSPN